MDRKRFVSVFYFLAMCLFCLIVVSLNGPKSVSGATQAQTEPITGDPIEPDGQIGGITNGLAARGDFVYLGVGPRLVVLDLSGLEAFDNYDDYRVGQTLPLPDIVRDVVVDGSYAYVAAGTAGLRVIDISDPTAPREVAALAVGENARAIDHEGTTVYLGDNGPSGLHVIDVSDPTAPRELGAAKWRAGIWEISVAGNYAYVADGYDLFIFDVADPAAPRQVGSVGTNCSALDVALAGDYAYVADHDNCGLLIADISDPTIQTHVSYAFPEEAFYLNPTLWSSDQHESVRVEVAGQYAYVAHKVVIYADNGETYTRSQLTIFDITNPAAPDPVARFNLNENRPYSQVTDLVIDGNAAYLSTVDGWLYVVDLSDLRLSNPVDHYPVLGPVVGVVADGGRVTAATTQALHDGFENGLDRSYFLLRQTMEERIVSWLGVDGAGYMTTESDVITIDLHGVDELFGPMPTELGRNSPSQRPFHTAQDGGRLWLFYYRDGEIIIADATTPGRFSGGGAVPTPEALSYNPSRVVVGNGIAYLFYFESPPWMIDLRGDTPQPIGFLGDAAVEDVAAIGDVAYAATGDGLRRYDLTEPASPRLLDPLPGVGVPLALDNAGPYLFVAAAGGRLSVFDTATAEPALVAVLRGPNELVGVSVDGDKVYVAAGESGLWAYTLPGLDELGAEEPSGLVFDNFPLSEAILVYVDENDDLALENVDTAVVARLTTSGDVNNYVLAPTRDRVLYVDQSGRAHAMALDFHADGLLSVQTLPVSFLPGATEFRWASDGQHLAYRDADFTWWITGLSGSDAPFPLSDRIYYLGGWSPDGQWVFYCTAEYAFEIVNVSGHVTPVDQDISCDRVEGGEWARWSPAAPLLAYARGRIGREPDGLRPVIFNAATGEHIELPVDHYIMDWSPDGRYLALAKEWSAGGQQVVESITIVNDQGVVIEQLPGYRIDTLGAVGWVRATEEEAIFGRYQLGHAPGESQSHIDALFGVSEDGATRWWGLVGDASFVVLCTDGDGANTDVYHSLNPTFPDGSQPSLSTPQSGIRTLLSPDGSTAVIDAYEGGEVWRRMLLRCEGGEPLIDTPADILNRHLFSYSADSRRILWYESADGQLAPRVYGIADTTELLPTSARVRRTAAWLITPNAAPTVIGTPVPPITQVNAIAGQVTDHTGAPLPGAEVQAGELTTTTDESGVYRFDDLEDGSYTVAVALAGYVFAAPVQVTVPPAQLAVNFQAEPPAGYTLTGRVTDCAGLPVPGVAISADGADGPTTTDADGRYALASLERRRYTVTAAAAGRAFLPDRRMVDLARYAPGETLTVDFTATTPARDEFCIAHLEIIQVVQDEYNSAPIIAGKPAVLRAYLHCPDCEPDETVTGTLQAFRADDGVAIPAQGEPFTATMDKPSGGVTWATHRGDLARSLNFLLPPEWLEGEVRFRVSANSASAELDVTFEPGKSLRLYYVSFNYVPPQPAPVPGPTPIPATEAPDKRVIDWSTKTLLAMLPLASHDLVYSEQGGFTQTMTTPFVQGPEGGPHPAEEYLQALNAYWLRMEQTNGWRDGVSPDRLIGWVASYDGFVAGIAASAYSDNSGRVAAVQTLEIHDGHHYLGSYALAHELAHILDDQGLAHTPFDPARAACSDELPDDMAPDYPSFDPAGSIGDWGVRIYGSRYELVDPAVYYDIVSYCVPYWISLHNYKRFSDGFQMYDPATAAVSAAPEPRLLISGRVLSATQTIEFDPIFQVEAVAPPTPDADGEYCLELRDVADAPLDRRCFSPSFREGITGHATETAGFQLAIPWIDGAMAVVATHDGQDLGRVAASGQPPALDSQMNWQVSEDGSTLTVTWRVAVDGDGDDLVYNVGLSGARGYIPLAFGIREQQLTVDARQLPGGEPLNVVVEVSDGFHSSRSESPKPLDLPAKPPVVAIAPVEAPLIAGQPFWLFGLARDVEDGVLSDEALVWSVNGEELGRGAQLFATLPPGEHTLTLTATDSDGEQTSAETTLLLEGVPEETTEGTNWLGWIVLGSGVVLLGGLLFLMWARRRSIS